MDWFVRLETDRSGSYVLGCRQRSGRREPSKFSKAKAQTCYQDSDSDKFLKALCPQGIAPRLRGWHQAHHEKFSLSCTLERPVAFLICRRQLACLILQLLQLLQLRHATEDVVGVSASSRMQPVLGLKLEILTCPCF